MPTVDVYDMQGRKVGDIELSEEVFGQRPDPALLHQVITMYQANRRAGTASTKTRAEVRGGGRKPWRQKGTGRARHGSIRSPLWRGGGGVFGPKPRDYSYSVPKKVRRAAIRQALSSRVLTGNVRVIDRLHLDEPRTQVIARMLAALGIRGSALLVTSEPDANVVKSVRNLPGVSAMFAAGINAYEVLAHEQLVMTLGAVEKLQEVFS